MVEKVVAVKISGRVQGVGYRQWMVEAARARDLRGWVRNRTEGWVEAMIAGPAAVVDDLIVACRSGPEMSEVESVEQSTPEVSGLPAPETAGTFVARATR